MFFLGCSKDSVITSVKELLACLKNATELLSYGHSSNDSPSSFKKKAKRKGRKIDGSVEGMKAAVEAV